MNLLRKMSSGLRSSRDLTKKSSGSPAENPFAESPSDMNEEEDELKEILLHDPDQDDGDPFEDAAAASPPGQQQPRQHEADENLNLSSRQEEPEVPIRVRAPVSDEQDELDVDDDVGRRDEEVEEEEEEEEDDRRGSQGSGESFDSALERMAASSEASYDTALSPKMLSPVGSAKGPGVIGNPPHYLQASQQGALRRLNELISGNSSLDMSLINSSSEIEFKSRVSQLAESRGETLEDSSFSGIVDTLLPLVLEKSRGKTPSPQTSSKLDEDVDAHSVGVSNVGFDQAQPQSPMPKAKLTAEDEPFDELEGESDEDLFEVDVLENGEKEIEDFNVGKGEQEVEEHPQMRQEGPMSGDGENKPEATSNFVRVFNGDALREPAVTQAMPVAKLSAEDEDALEEREDDELSAHGQEDNEEPVEETIGGVDNADDGLPLKIRAVPSDLDDSAILSLSAYENPTQKLGDIGNNDKISVLAEVQNSVKGEENHRRPVAKLSDEDAQSLEDHPEVESASSESPEVVARDFPAEVSEETEIIKSEDEGATKGDESVQIPAGEKAVTEGERALKGDESAQIPAGEKVVTEVEGATNGDEFIRIPAGGQEVTEDEGATKGDESTQTSAGEKVVTEDEGATKGDEAAHIPAEEKAVAEADILLRGFDEAEEDEVEDEEDDEEDEEDNDEEGEDSLVETMLRGAESSSSREAVEAVPLLGSAGPSLPARPTRPVRSSLPSLEPASRAVQQPNSTQAPTIQSSSSVDESQANAGPAVGNDETREKLQSIRVKLLRLAFRLGQSPHNVVVAQVLYRLGLAEQLRGGRGSSGNIAAYTFDRASVIAEEQERTRPEELDFACTILILGKTGVGKSATINSIFDEVKTGTDAFSPATNKVQIITGHVHGIKVRVIDTPGLLPSVIDQKHNERILASVKGFIKKQSPDIVLYFDRLDIQSRDSGDLPLLRTITETFGAAVWFNAIVVLTHASSGPPDGPNGLPLSYEMFVAQRSHVVQQTIRQSAGDMRLMNPVSLVENHRACRVNRSGERVLPNGQVWKPQLLLLCFASKILAEANSLLKLQTNTPGKPFGQRSRVPPLPFLLSSLLQCRHPLKLPDEQVGDEDVSDEELEEDGSSDEEEDYDQLPPFRRLAKEEIAELDEETCANYYEELAERERLFQKKQWKEELKRRREMKKRMGEAPTDQSQVGTDDGLEEEARSAAVPVPMLDMVLPPSFDSDNPSHRYRYLETANQWLVRPVLETHGWDHDNGYDGMSVEKMFVIGNKIPTSVSGQITKDKKDVNLNMEIAGSLSHGEGKVTLAGLDVQTVGKDLAYTLRSETRFSNFKGNKTTGGLAVTLLGETVSAGMKIEDRLLIGKRVKLVVNGGPIVGGGDVAYGGSLEATLRDKDYPLSRTLTTLGVSIMDWHGDLAVGGNLQSQFILGKTMMVGRANLNNRGAGQITIRASSSEQLQMALIGVLPIVRAILNRLFGQSQE